MILVDTNVVSETLKPSPDPQVIQWLIQHDAEIALPCVVIAEVAYGIEKIRPDQRARRLARGLAAWRERFRDRILSYTESDALTFGKIMGQAAQQGRPMPVPDGMIAAVAHTHNASLATRNIADFRHSGLDLIDPWMATGVQEG